MIEGIEEAGPAMVWFAPAGRRPFVEMEVFEAMNCEPNFS
jgi:hypothetical protein